MSDKFALVVYGMFLLFVLLALLIGGIFGGL